MLTLSLANWMELPGLKLKDWMREKRRYSEQQALSICFKHTTCSVSSSLWEFFPC